MFGLAAELRVTSSRSIVMGTIGVRAWVGCCNGKRGRGSPPRQDLFPVLTVKAPQAATNAVTTKPHTKKNKKKKKVVPAIGVCVV